MTNTLQNYLKPHDITVNINNFTEGKSRILFITGISGAGKTTLAKKLSLDLNLELFSIDKIRYKLGILKKKNPEVYKMFYIYLVNSLIESKRQLIIEGVGVLNLDYRYLCNQPLIIVKSSVLKSSIIRIIQHKPLTFHYIYDIFKSNIFEYGYSIRLLEKELNNVDYEH